jgi:hypothetical protein
MLGVAQQQADSLAAYRSDMAENARQRLRMGMSIPNGAAGADAAGLQMPGSPFDYATAADIAKSTVKKEAAEAAEAGSVLTAAQLARRQDEIVNAMWQQHMVRFPLQAAQGGLPPLRAGSADYTLPRATAALQPQPSRGSADPEAEAEQEHDADIAQAAQQRPPPASGAMAPPAWHLANLRPMSEHVATLTKQLAAVARSGDHSAVLVYAKQLDAAKAARDAEAVRRLGPQQAQRYIRSLPE